ncbi:hypothetical protein LU293_05000 [Moraxella nasovis]|uniref:hypothetical protein n=1 Tax=Moraxella nasovis TaxID=2904121 RepID=UPI001F622EE3|nr:hypothetical protein [Moraxella nasovis]UNU74249.1 hypothetical protein LU293_05000 [Moraxella nasovis]
MWIIHQKKFVIEIAKKCFYIRDLSDKSKFRQVSILSTKAIKKPTDFENFKEFCQDVIQDFKYEKRKELASIDGLNYQEFDLYSNPTTTQIVQEFLDKNELTDKLDLIISPNDLGNHIPFLLDGHKYLEQDFLNFYHQKVQNDEIEFFLKARKTQ